MKLNTAQLSILNAVSAARKASYSVATANGGNGKTVDALIRNKQLVKNEPTPKVKEVTYSLTDEAKATLKEMAKAAKKKA